MDRGFQIEIQRDLTKEETEIAINFANRWIVKTCDNALIYYLGGRSGGYSSFIRRNRFGFMLKDSQGLCISKDIDLVFRRISTNKRIFGIVKASAVVKQDRSEVNLKQCMCPIHRAGERVVWRDIKPKTFVYATIGEI